jgi:hypothetical protein
LDASAHLRAGNRDSSESMDSLLFGDKSTTYYIGASAIPSTILSYLSSAPNTSELIAPSEIQ